MVAGKFGEHEDFVWCQRLTEQVAFLDSALFHDGPFWVSVCTHVSGLCQLCFALLLTVEWAKLVSLRVDYMDGSSKTIKDLRRVKVDQEHQDVIAWEPE